MFVYLITNLVNGKRYVGQTSSKNLERYWKQCFKEAQKGKKSKPALYNAIRKYGYENFEIKPLVIVNSKWELDLYEKGLIKAWDLRNSENGYNLTDGGEGTPGRIMSEENRKKLSQRMKGKKYALGRIMSEDNKQKLLLAHIGMKHTEEARRKISEGHKGKVHSEDHKRKISKALMGNSWNKGKILSEEVRHKISESLKKVVSEEDRLRFSMNRKGKKHSPESIEKMKEAQRIRRLRELAAKEGHAGE